MVLDDAAATHGRALKAETLEAMHRNGLPAGRTRGGWRSSIPSLSNDGECDPGVKTTWPRTFPRRGADGHRSPGGFWGSQILSFHDRASYPGCVDFEAAVYRHLPR